MMRWLQAGLFMALLVFAAPTHALGITDFSGSPRAVPSDTSHSDPMKAHFVTSYGIGYGSSLLGFDTEYLLAPYLGLRAGAGLLGMDAGISLHFAPGLRTHHLNLGYHRLGISGDLYSGSAVGASLVFRDRGLLTMEIGIGRAISTGSADHRLRPGAAVLLLGIGVCPRPR